MCEKPTYKELAQRNKALEEKFAKHGQSEGELLALEKRYRNLFDSISDLNRNHEGHGSGFARYRQRP